ncbi:MAG: 1,4-dihydroxy-2-naphthoate polyprenyltransferase [Candidatus Omnitrophota bacterium]
MNLSELKNWLLAIRPKTLPAAIAPVIIGTAMAASDHRFHFFSALAALLGALLIQILANLTNDYFDFKKGADTNERIGPTRVMQAGLINSKQMKIAIAIVVGLIGLVTAFLFFRGGIPIAIIGVLSIICAFLYTAGPFSLGYLGLGEVFVFIFFGLVAVTGTYFVQALTIKPIVLIAGIAPGLLSVAILTVNNLRDLDQDRKAGKKTLAVRFGRAFAIMEYFYSIVIAAFVPLILFFITVSHSYALTSMIILLLAAPAMRTVFTKTDGPVLNETLAYTGQLLFIYSLLFSLGWIL